MGTDTVAHSKFWGSLLKKYGPTAARLAGHAIKAYMGLAETSSSAQEKFWGSLLKKYGPTAARLAGKAISAYMGLSQTSKGTIKSRIGNLVKNCKALWKGVRPKCLKSIRCATTIVTQCLNKKACRVGVIRSEVKRTCKGKAKCMKTANARITQIWRKVQREAKRVVKGKMLAQTTKIGCPGFFKYMCA